MSKHEALSPQALLGFALADVTRLLRTIYDARLSAKGLSGASWRVLAYLYREDGLTQTKLADLLEVSRSAIGQMIDRLEAGGFVERRSDPADRRSWGVYLSPQAHETVGELMRASYAIETECFAIFNEKDLALLANLVGRLRDHLGTLPGAARKGGPGSD
ncbi:MarR family winged helix-turn-helix transcriptional regulator [Vitreimonas flagellata]|uniref:MarR family winged helix-turn-helix transcriptional regulator n=1 Tax=Vitreimonas flagellata TaxID=2560861 RepID=UPI0014300D86|nr:MarR family transcriptional regulator [Vitreimonas flagellata]